MKKNICSTCGHHKGCHLKETGACSGSCPCMKFTSKPVLGGFTEPENVYAIEKKNSGGMKFYNNKTVNKIIIDCPKKEKTDAFGIKFICITVEDWEEFINKLRGLK